MTHGDIISAHRLLDKARPETFIEAQNFLLALAKKTERVNDPSTALQGLTAFYYSLLDSGRLIEAALLLWGYEMFDPRSRSVGLIWEGLNTGNKALILGGGSQGKTWTISGWSVLYWTHDPANTTGKIISTTAGHAKANIMAKIKNFHRRAALPLLGDEKAGGIFFGNDEGASISQVSIPEGDSGEGKLTGFHPTPRKVRHPLFGDLTRIFAIVDEADVVPGGLWAGLDNVLGNENAAGSVKVAAMTNPRDKANPFAARAEPAGGWEQVDPDDDRWDKWTSRDGWTVIRLDPSKSENVVQQRDVFPGMMTYEGYLNYVRKGTSHPDYWTYGRGMYPSEGVEFIVVAPMLFNAARGKFTFIGSVTNLASLDPAFAQGGDNPRLTTALYGTAIGFTPLGQPPIDFQQRPINVIQVEQQFNIRKGPTPQMGKETIDILRMLRVAPEWFVMDRTGNATGLYDHIRWQFGSILGIMWGEGATEQKILEEDTETADERFDGITAEMYFAFAQWLEFGYIKFAPLISTYPQLFQQFTTRKWHYKRTLQALEDKASFKAHNDGESPDEADSAVMLVHLVRMRAANRPAMIPDNPKHIVSHGELRWPNMPSEVDKMRWVET